jgi:hypothetical protein
MLESPLDILLALLFGGIGSGLASVIAAYFAGMFHMAMFSDAETPSWGVGIVAFIISLCLPIGGAIIGVRLYTGSTEIGLIIIATVIGIGGVFLFTRRTSGMGYWGGIILLPFGVLFGSPILFLGIVRQFGLLFFDMFIGKVRWITLLANRLQIQQIKQTTHTTESLPGTYSGTLAFWDRTNKHFRLHLLRMADGDHQVFTLKHVKNPTLSRLRWNPTGDRLMFTRDLLFGNDAYGAAVHILDLPSLKINRVPVNGYGVGWSADGKQILIENASRSTYQLSWLNADTFKTTQILKGLLPQMAIEKGNYHWKPRKPLMMPKWSPDNRWLVFGKNGHLLCADMQSLPERGMGELRILTRAITDLQETHINWSPNSQQIVFVYRWNIHTIDVNGENMAQLTHGGGCDYPVWSPDGQYIAYRKNGMFWIMRSDGSEAKRLLKAGTNYHANFSLQWGATNID